MHKKTLIEKQSGLNFILKKEYYFFSFGNKSTAKGVPIQIEL